ncbi:hypothetical protein FHR71_003644 [Methylobacterium sp. RAS18]|nr:hypothetical protein [Methylobacterium sp. RAS18]
MLNKLTVAQAVRNRLHAEAQGRSDNKRRERNAPRRDDLARAAYYALLLAYREALGLEKERNAGRIRRSVLSKLEDAGFDVQATAAIFDDHARSAERDLDAWIAARKIAKGKAAAQSAAE